MTEELDYLLARVRQAKEILGEGGIDCAYEANKVLEIVAFRIQALRDTTKGDEA